MVPKYDNCGKQSPSLEANSSTATQKILRVLCSDYILYYAIWLIGYTVYKENIQILLTCV